MPMLRIGDYMPAGSRCESEPVSRTPPQALVCPVNENGVAPGRPICPVIRCRALSMLLRNTPCVRWLMPMVQSDVVACERANRKATF